MDGNRAYGVEFLHHGKKYSATALKEVILSAGSINSPQLLMLSGIGPKEKLEKLGIPSVADVKDVGQNLYDHPAYIPLVFGTNVTVPSLTMADYIMQYFNGEGPLTSGSGVAGLRFLRFDSSTMKDPTIEQILFIGVADQLQSQFFTQSIMKILTHSLDLLRESWCGR